jgi:crotonobetainyl-CoA:carnitine CoA-transferase CaiB-like acyl-CoA transferase
MGDGTTGGFLAGVKVLELADEVGEYCGKVLAGIGADVIKVEPPGGEKTRSYGPFYQDTAGPDRSLYFWHYNFGKRSVTLDLAEAEGRARFGGLLGRSDVLLMTRPRPEMEALGFGDDELRARYPALIIARITPFGDTGPWAEYKGSDLIHLALGGVMMNCGYDPDPFGVYETPPVAPQMWHAYHIAGEQTATGIMAALVWRLASGEGQVLSTAVHEAVAKQTEADMPNWIYSRFEHKRRTGRHSSPFLALAENNPTKDGRWLVPYTTYLTHPDATKDDAFERTVAILAKYDSAEDLTDPKYKSRSVRDSVVVKRHILDVTRNFCRRLMFDREVWREFQAAGLTWAPLNRPEENLAEPHWRARESFFEVEHPELSETFTEVGAKWMCEELPWRRGPRAPLLGEHTDEVLKELLTEPSRAAIAVVERPVREPVLSRHGKPFALAGVRFIDLSWLLASAGAGRYLAALGAEVIKVEHFSRPDVIRWSNAIVGPGGRAAREAATGPVDMPKDPNPNRSGFFMEINSGKRAISLNLKHPRARELLTELIAGADIVAEGFSPGTMDRMGFGYERLKQINPRIIYAQQSGMGQHGTFGGMRSYGPVAQGFSGLSEMSGFPDPYPPAGIGYSFLDWFGAYNLANAMMAALYRQRVTGKGCWIDSSQVESGLYLLGSSILEYSANGRRWQRLGNRSPYKPAAPHGAYRTAGEDRWLAVACFTEEEWRGLVEELGSPGWAVDERFGTLAGRLAHQDELDRRVDEATRAFEGRDLMDRLQRRGVPAGLCQTAQDRYENDPQLRHLEWLVELPQTEIGTWPVKEFPVKLGATPAYMGGLVGRHGPNYGEDNEYVFGEILGLSQREIRDLADAGVI